MDHPTKEETCVALLTMMTRKLSGSGLVRLIHHLELRVSIQGHQQQPSIRQLRRTVYNYIKKVRAGKGVRVMMSNAQRGDIFERDEANWPPTITQTQKDGFIRKFDQMLSESCQLFVCASCAVPKPLADRSTVSANNPSIDLGLLVRPDLRSKDIKISDSLEDPDEGDAEVEKGVDDDGDGEDDLSHETTDGLMYDDTELPLLVYDPDTDEEDDSCEQDDPGYAIETIQDEEAVNHMSVEQTGPDLNMADAKRDDLDEELDTLLMMATERRDPNRSGGIAFKPWLADGFRIPDSEFHDHSTLANLLLEPAGVEVNNTDANHQIHLCSTCMSALKKKQVPVFAIANRMYLGAVPSVLKDLSTVEQNMVARCRTKVFLLKLQSEEDNKQGKISQRGFHGHIVVHPQQPTSITNVLPPLMDEITNPVCVIFIGPRPPTEDWLKANAKPLCIRPGKV
ncbi:hypothetical protein AAF712_010046 [Marasmius tenuissimus]|uniref:DUF6570 domain-containing protein n=1 Tax=Marasmius tenuissimus TaxID=585030 RepID=A0ABR2ZNM7_9AGAR